MYFSSMLADCGKGKEHNPETIFKLVVFVFLLIIRVDNFSLLLRQSKALKSYRFIIMIERSFVLGWQTGTKLFKINLN